MFGAKYSRLKFWIVSICLLIPTAILNGIAGAIEQNNPDNAIFFYGIVFLLSLIWINTLANRIRDYGSNPWISLFAFIPLVNIGLSFYYGIANKKEPIDNVTKNNDNYDTSLTKAVYNHSKDVVREVKPTINQYKENHKTSKSEPYLQNDINEDLIYEQVMIEIEENRKVKSTWAKALAESEGNKDIAESLYINFRVKEIKMFKEKEQDKNQLEKEKNLSLSKEIKLKEFLKEKDFNLVNRVNSDLAKVSSNKHVMNGELKFIDEEWKFTPSKIKEINVLPKVFSYILILFVLLLVTLFISRS